jgi:DmsE family decaheme c-type cytochrome
MGFSIGLWLLAVALFAPPMRTPAQAPAQAPAQGGYAGSKACTTECHIREAAAFAETNKGKLFLQHPQNEMERKGCEGCHGPGAKHIESGGEDFSGMTLFGKKSKTPVAERNALCLQCHEKTARMFWQGSSHESREVACTDCHDVMKAVSERASLKRATVLATCTQCHLQRRSQQLRFSHMPVGEGRIECTSCHNPHGSPNDKLLVAPSVNEVCYSCHTEKRGPFLWEHPPVVENCANCHDPHGSNHEKMLKTAKPRLCQQCHDPTRHPSRAYAQDAVRYIPGRQCANCHFNLHGSNHPSGHVFTR